MLCKAQFEWPCGAFYFDGGCVLTTTLIEDRSRVFDLKVSLGIKDVRISALEISHRPTDEICLLIKVEKVVDLSAQPWHYAPEAFKSFEIFRFVLPCFLLHSQSAPDRKDLVSI
jgi:hypothetical protein